MKILRSLLLLSACCAPAAAERVWGVVDVDGPEGWERLDYSRSGTPELRFTLRGPEGVFSVGIEQAGPRHPVIHDRRAFERALTEGEMGAKRSRRSVSGVKAALFEGFRTGTPEQIPHYDPYSGDLPDVPRAMASAGKSRKKSMPQGGNAYKMLRCKVAKAYRNYNIYAALTDAGRRKEYFLDDDPVTSRALDACFGPAVLAAMHRGAPLPPVAEPQEEWLWELAEQERESGKRTAKAQRQAVLVVPHGENFFILRYRAPEAFYASRRQVFDAFVESFRIVKEKP